MRRRAAAAGAQGFTLIEVLLATVLLAAGLAIAFSTLGAWPPLVVALPQAGGQAEDGFMGGLR